MSVRRKNNSCGCREKSNNDNEAFCKEKSALKINTGNPDEDFKGTSYKPPSTLRRTKTWDKLKNINYEDDYTIEQLQREAEMELEKALKILKATEHVLDPPKSSKEIPSGSLIQVENEGCISTDESDSKPLTKFPFKCECNSGSSDSNISHIKFKKTNEKDLPQKPKLTSKQISQFLEAERKDVDLALHLSLDTEEIYKKPCPKQQKAKQGIKQMADLKKNNKESPCEKTQIRELIEPDPEDISPDTMAAIIFSQEKGVLLDSSPHFTVRHLFPDRNKKKQTSEEIKSDFDFMLSPDDECSTRGAMDEVESPVPPPGKTYSLEEGSEFYVDASEDFQFQAESRYRNKIQLRGSSPPWFPGYLAAFPDGGNETVHFVKSPVEVFQRAWMSVKPSYMPSNDIFVIE